ncbi:MAG: hypothetical protein K1X72_28820 [Pyrinomonadaceae bacterium]|nr:hypothetical protein [Pyrinomonadaceae bacterium]
MALPLQQTFVPASEQLAKHSSPAAVPIGPGCAPPLPAGQQNIPTGRKKVEAQFPDGQSPGTKQRTDEFDCAATALGAITEAIIGKAAIEAKPAFFTISRRDKLTR